MYFFSLPLQSFLNTSVHGRPYKLIRPLLMRPYANQALYQMDVPALSYIYATYGKSGLISNGKE